MKRIIVIVLGMDTSTDGIEMVKENEWLVSSWNGLIYYVSSN